MAATSAHMGSAGAVVLLRRALRPNKWWVVALAVLTLASGASLVDNVFANIQSVRRRAISSRRQRT